MEKIISQIKEKKRVTRADIAALIKGVSKNNRASLLRKNLSFYDRIDKVIADLDSYTT